MSATTPTRQSGSFNTLALVSLGLFLALLITGSLAGWSLPFLQNERYVLIAVFILGQVMCGIGMRIGTFSWAHPSSMVGALIGVLLYIGVLGYLFGLKLPYLTSDRAVIMFMAGLMLVKVLVDVVRMFFRRRMRVSTN